MVCPGARAGSRRACISSAFKTCKSELMRLHADLVMCYKVVLGLVKLSFADFIAFSPVKPGTHWRQS